MLGRTHQILGITSALVLYPALVPAEYNPATLGFALVGAHFAALLPDLDQPGARFWRQLPFGRVMGELVDPFLAHRNLSHSLLGLGLAAYLFHWLLNLIPTYWGVHTGVVFWVLIASYLSHLLADALTEQGIPLLFPLRISFGIPPNPFQALRIETGKWFENLIIFPLANLFLVAYSIMHWDFFKAVLFH